MKDFEEYSPVDQHAWRKWLEVNHHKKEAVWLIFHKKKSPNYNLSWSESVDQALCFGWIDSTKRSIDSEKYKQYFCKRKPKSNWSKINKEKVASLIDLGLMEKEGYKSIETAKQNGSWTILDEVESLVIPKDLKEALSNYNGALEHFNNLSNSAKKLLLHRVFSAKRKETREKRILEIVTYLNQRIE